MKIRIVKYPLGCILPDVTPSYITMHHLHLTYFISNMCAMPPFYMLLLNGTGMIIDIR